MCSTLPLLTIVAILLSTTATPLSPAEENGWRREPVAVRQLVLSQSLATMSLSTSAAALIREGRFENALRVLEDQIESSADSAGDLIDAGTWLPEDLSSLRAAPERAAKYARANGLDAIADKTETLRIPTPDEAEPLPEPTDDSQTAEIAAIAEAWRTNYNAGDAEKVAALYAQDGYYLSAHVLAQGRSAIQAYWERGIAAGGHVDFIMPLRVVRSGALGYWLGTYQATNAGVTVDGRLVIVVTQVDGKWLIAAHETVVRDQP